MGIGANGGIPIGANGGRGAPGGPSCGGGAPVEMMCGEGPTGGCTTATPAAAAAVVTLGASPAGLGSFITGGADTTSPSVGFMASAAGGAGTGAAAAAAAGGGDAGMGICGCSCGCICGCGGATIGTAAFVGEGAFSTVGAATAAEGGSGGPGTPTPPAGVRGSAGSLGGGGGGGTCAGAGAGGTSMPRGSPAYSIWSSTVPKRSGLLATKLAMFASTSAMGAKALSFLALATRRSFCSFHLGSSRRTLRCSAMSSDWTSWPVIGQRCIPSGTPLRPLFCLT
mmetsp:Transcript_219/g.710  ORF Transcript_219/g.710 Transcript_219/m.710 type:complete len:282 (+) Transcript_219:632-1477(+)